MRIRDLINASLNRATRLALRIRLAVQRAFGLTHGYHPDPFGSCGGQDQRVSQDRFLAFKAALPQLKRPSVIDVGCNQGFFTFRMAEAGGVCLGLDTDRNELMVARALGLLNRIENAAFLQLEINEDSADGLPSADLVICLSIYHHWARHHGESRADAILAAIAGKARHALVFETGQPDEDGASWTGQLGFMLPNPDAWARAKLASLGFAEVEMVGAFPTTVSPNPRNLYVGRR